jgi:hypothetical protein
VIPNLNSAILPKAIGNSCQMMHKQIDSLPHQQRWHLLTAGNECGHRLTDDTPTFVRMPAGFPAIV